MLTGLLSPRAHREFCKTLKVLFFILAVVAPFLHGAWSGTGQSVVGVY